MGWVCFLRYLLNINFPKKENQPRCLLKSGSAQKPRGHWYLTRSVLFGPGVTRKSHQINFQMKRSSSIEPPPQEYRTRPPSPLQNGGYATAMNTPTTPLTPLKVLIACEYSGAERDAFTALGHDATSCDLLPSQTPGKHHQGDLREIIDQNWDLLIAHPPCTYMTVAGIHWNRRAEHKRGRDEINGKTWGERQTEEAVDFVRFLLSQEHIPKICLENPVSVISSRVRKPDQIVQPWQYGHPESKATCLWLKGLPPLQPTNIVAPPAWRCCQSRVPPEGVCVVCLGVKRPKPLWANMTPSGQNRLGPSADRWKVRSTTYAGIAAAMAQQWGGLVV